MLAVARKGAGQWAWQLLNTINMSDTVTLGKAYDGGEASPVL